MRRAARTDATQTEVIRTLRQLGVSVEVIGKPVDLLVCFRGETSLMEVKAPRARSEGGGHGLTKDQVEFIARWPGKIHVVKSAGEAVEALMPALCR